MADIEGIQGRERIQVHTVLEGIFANHPTAVYVTNSDFKVIYQNVHANALLEDTSITGKHPVSIICYVADKLIGYKNQLLEGQSFNFQLGEENDILDVTSSSITLAEESYFLITVKSSEKKYSSLSSESLYKPLIEQSPIATAIFATSGKPQFINDAFQQLFTISDSRLEEIQNNYNLFKDDQLIEHGMISLIEKCLDGDAVELPTFLYNFSVSPFFGDNESPDEKFIKGNLFPLKNSQGIVKDIVIILSDVSFQKQAEQILTDAHLKFQMLNLNLPGAFYEFERSANGTDGKFIYMSQGCQEIFGIEPERIIQDASVVDRMIHPDDVEAYRKSVELSDIHRKSWEWEGRIIVNGKVKWLEARSSLRVQNGRRISYGVLLDITEKKFAEEQFKTADQLFTQLFKNAPLGIVLLDEGHKVLQANDGFVSLFGYSKNEIIGNALNTIIVPDDSIEEAHNINVLTGSGKVGKLESIRKKKNGELVPVLIYGVPVRLNEKTIGIYGIYVDISDRKNAERELQIRNNELDNFVYKVSHDLRAPLSSILGLVNLARNINNDDDPHMYITLIGQRVKQLDSFISDVLSHSKNLKLEVTTSQILFSEIVEGCLKDLSYLPGADRIRHELNISDEPFYSDHWRINEIFRNLISNAIKYMNPNQKDPFIKINIDVNNTHAKIIVEDNGLGIEKSLQPRIFEMFYRATVYSEGSGIGLYIVKNAIEKLGGTINLISEPEKGTTFAIEIPNCIE